MKAWRSGRVADCTSSSVGRRFALAPPHAAFDTFLLCRTSLTFANNKFDGYHLKICSTPVSFGPASPDAGVELLRQLFLQCTVRCSILTVARLPTPLIFRYPLPLKILSSQKEWGHKGYPSIRLDFVHNHRCFLGTLKGLLLFFKFK